MEQNWESIVKPLWQDRRDRSVGETTVLKERGWDIAKRSYNNEEKQNESKEPQESFE